MSFLIVFIGVLLINGDPRDIWSVIIRKKREEGSIKGLPEILIAVGLYSLWIIALDQFISGINWIPILLLIRIIATLSLFLFAKNSKQKIIFNNRSIWKYIFFIAIFDVTALSFVSYGFSSTPYVSIVTMLSGAFSLPTIILGRVFLKESATTIQIIGSFTVVAGVMLLSLI